MSITEFTELRERLSLNELAARENVHVGSVWRWILSGIGGRRLPSFRVGGRRYVDLNSYSTWLREINSTGLASDPKPETPAQAERAFRELEQQANGLGL